jgi:hypothetical protein
MAVLEGVRVGNSKGGASKRNMLYMYSPDLCYPLWCFVVLCCRAAVLGCATN